MRLLRKINIKGSDWKITRKHIGLDTDGNKILGQTWEADRLIELDKELEGKQLQEVFWHEFIHALFYELHITYQFSKELNEIIADNVATGITSLMTNELTKYRLKAPSKLPKQKKGRK
jgi:hypothetical protein